MSPNTQSQLLQIWRSSHLQKRIVHANRQMRKTQWTLKCQGSWQSSPKRLRKLLKNKQISRTHNPFNAPLKPIIRKRDHNKKNPSHLQDPTFGTYACSLRRNSFVDHLVSAVRRVFGPFSTGFAIRNSQLAAETRQIRPLSFHWPLFAFYPFFGMLCLPCSILNAEDQNVCVEGLILLISFFTAKKRIPLPPIWFIYLCICKQGYLDLGQSNAV